MCAFYGLIASGVTHVHRNSMCMCVRACVRVRVHARGWTGVRIRLRGENSILMHNYFIYKNVI